MTLTGDTITDEQIFELRSSLRWEDDEQDIIVCDVALGALRSARLGSKHYDRNKARTRCAEMLNARKDANADG